jgi:hypothetical protein
VRIRKERLLDSLLQNFYDFVIKRYNKHSTEYSKGYRKGKLEVIGEVNKYQEEKKSFP